MAAETNEPLLSQAEGGSEPTSGPKHPYMRKCGIYCGSCCCIIFVLAWIVQGCIYAYATLGCGTIALRNYRYEETRSRRSQNHTCKENLATEYSILQQVTDNENRYLSQPTDQAGRITDAPSGLWRQYWGPIFTTYVFSDQAELYKLIYMRRNLLNLGMSHRMARCDDVPPFVVFKEGSENYFWNKWRHVRAWLFGRALAVNYQLLVDDVKISTVQETHAGDSNSIQFKSIDGVKQYASAAYDTSSDKPSWRIKNMYESPLPYWVSEAATLLFAIHTDHTEKKTVTPKPTPEFVLGAELDVEPKPNALAVANHRRRSSTIVEAESSESGVLLEQHV